MTTEQPSRRYFLAAVRVLAWVMCMHAAPATAQVYMTESGHAEFTSSLPAITFTGKSDYLVGRIDLKEDVVDFYLDLTTLRTGIGKRDKDMRETLETENYPFAEFFGRLESAIDISASDPQSVVVSGDFTVHGVTNQVRVEGTITASDAGLRVEAEWELNLNDYDIEPPSLLIIKVDEVQQIRIDALLTPVDD